MIGIMKYLDPKADMTFKKVFGEHEDLVISFLNSLLPFESEDELIKSVEYLNPELVPLNPLKKDSIVDVRCKDSHGRQFIVEMQMMWTSEYKQRVLFNASKAYVSQLECGQDYDLLHPVYSLNMVNDVYSDSEDYYHDYRIVEVAETNEVIEGLRFIFIELPKFTPKNYGDKKMQVLWLRYLTEINSRTRVVSEELTSNPVINKVWLSWRCQRSPMHSFWAMIGSGTWSVRPRCRYPVPVRRVSDVATKKDLRLV